MTPQQLVARAAAIVHVRAVAHEGHPRTDAEFPAAWGQVVFDVVRVLKGSVPHKPLRVIGGLSNHDDFNDQAVPYTFVRGAGRKGPCNAYEYRIGAEYLLLLDRDETQTLSPYWAYQHPTNEQARGATDPWIAWVENQLKRRR